MKNILERINGRQGNIEECINDLKARTMQIIQSEEQKEKQNLARQVARHTVR